MTKKAYAKTGGARTTNDNGGRPLERTKKRECLSCSKMFMSFGPQNRICEYCSQLKGRKNSEEDYFDPRPYLTFPRDPKGQ